MPPTDWNRDEALLAAWRRGNHHAGEALLKRHGPSVAAFFHNKVQVGAEDLTQTTFLRVLEGKARLREGRLFRAWVLGIAHNVFLEHLRELQCDHDIDVAVDSMADLAPGPVTLAGRRDEHRLLLEGLRRLSIDNQILLELIYWERFKSEDLGALLGVNPSTLRTRIQSAREQLQKVMAEIASSPQLLDSTSQGLDGWADDIRQEFARRTRAEKKS